MRPTSTLYSGWCPPHRSGFTPDPADERRAEGRVAIDAKALVKGDGDISRVEARAVDLSPGGLLIVTPTLHKVGDILRLTLQLPGDEEFSSTAIVRNRMAGRGNGVEFLMLPPEHVRSIGDLARTYEANPSNARPFRRGLYVY